MRNYWSTSGQIQQVAGKVPTKLVCLLEDHCYKLLSVAIHAVEQWLGNRGGGHSLPKDRSAENSKLLTLCRDFTSTIATLLENCRNYGT